MVRRTDNANIILIIIQMDVAITNIILLRLTLLLQGREHTAQLSQQQSDSVTTNRSVILRLTLYTTER